jgi:pyrimidine oxygenase
MRHGVFLPTTNNGYILSTSSPQYMPTYDLNRSIAVAAEKAGFDFALTMVKLRGYGADGDGFWDYARDPLAMLGGLAEATTSLNLYGSIGAPALHPAVAARIGASNDDQMSGRFGVNIVGGWNEIEYSQMGLWPGADYHSRRYSYVEEYIAILRGLWEKGRLTYHGEFFTLDDCIVQPVPEFGVTVIMPGQSPASLDAAAAQADINFILGDFETVSRARTGLVERTNATGRSVGSAALYGIITASTDADAVAAVVDFSHNTDYTAARNLSAAATTDPRGLSATAHLEPKDVPIDDVTFDHPDRAAAVAGSCLFHPHLVGSYDRVARYLYDLEHTADVTRSVLSFPDYLVDIEEFAAEVLPRIARLEENGV